MNDVPDRSFTLCAITARRLADDLLRRLAEEEVNAMARDMIGDGNTGMFELTDAEKRRAVEFLTLPPAAQDAAAEVINHETLTLILHARYMGLAIARAFEFADEARLVLGKELRNAISIAGAAITARPFDPSTADILGVSDAARQPRLYVIKD